MQNEIGDKGIGFDMKHFHFFFLLILLLASCQSVTATPAPPVNTLIAATSAPQKVVNKSTGILTVTPTPTGPAVHKSNSDANVSNLIIVSDQSLVNNSLTLDSVTSAQAGFIVLYYDNQRQGRDNIGKQITFVQVPAGKSNQFVLPLSQNLNPTVNLATLPSNPVIAVLQTNPSDPNSILKVNGKDVSVSFMILSSAQGHSSIFSTATP